VRTSTIVMIGFAVVFGLLAVFVAQSWLNHQAELRLRNIDTTPKTVATKTVVVAAAPLRFGTQLSEGALREVEWPGAAIPAGTFSSIAELASNGRRIVLASIEPNEPILRTKITGPGQRATLSAVIQGGMKAVTVRVNDVDGVGGFVLPGDHVDVLITRQAEKGSGNNDVVIQNVRVLAVDQIADDSVDRPVLVKAVTLEVDTVAAQKLSLASAIGALSLVLRKANVESTRQVTVSDLGNGQAFVNVPQTSNVATIGVTRASKRQEYTVPAESTDWREAIGAGHK